MSRSLFFLLFAWALSGCEPERVVGDWPCGSSSGPSGKAPDGGVAPVQSAVGLPWSSGFEDGFCGYAHALGFCYSNPDATFTIVSEPVHSGRRAARFSVTSQPNTDGKQARCVREGVLPSDAIYGAWYFVERSAKNTDNWNLMHFQGGLDPTHGLWDVSIGNAADGSLNLYLFDFLRGSVRTPDAPLLVPVGKWFHVQVHLRRAVDATGQVALFQDGSELLNLTGLSTDDSDWGQWYVGNLEDALTPPDSTIYVDDVSIGPPP